MGIYLVTWKWRWLLQECRNTFYYDTTVGEPSDGEWQDIVDEIRGYLVTDWTARMSDEATFYAIDRRRVDSAGLLSFEEIPTAGALVGNVATESNPTQIALLVRVKGVTTKPNRARTYLPSTVASNVADSQFITGVVAAAETLISSVKILNSLGTNPLSRVAAQWNVGHTAVVATNDISTATPVASTVPATQRRRRIGVGI